MFFGRATIPSRRARHRRCAGLVPCGPGPKRSVRRADARPVGAAPSSSSSSPSSMSRYLVHGQRRGWRPPVLLAVERQREDRTPAWAGWQVTAIGAPGRTSRNAENARSGVRPRPRRRAAPRSRGRRCQPVRAFSRVDSCTVLETRREPRVVARTAGLPATGRQTLCAPGSERSQRGHHAAPIVWPTPRPCRLPRRLCPAKHSPHGRISSITGLAGSTAATVPAQQSVTSTSLPICGWGRVGRWYRMGPPRRRQAPQEGRSGSARAARARREERESLLRDSSAGVRCAAVRAPGSLARHRGLLAAGGALPRRAAYPLTL